MAKKKKRKESTSSFTYSIELTGLIFILIGIIGLGFGPIGLFIKEFALFLAGEFWYIILFAIGVFNRFIQLFENDHFSYDIQFFSCTCKR